MPPAPRVRIASGDLCRQAEAPTEPVGETGGVAVSRDGGIVKAKGGMRKAKLRVAALRSYFYLTDRLLADEAVFFARGKHKCLPYG